MKKIIRVVTLVLCLALSISLFSMQSFALNNPGVASCSKTYSVSENDIGIFGDPIPVADNINLFSRAYDGFNHDSSTSNEFTGDFDGYGVVNIYRNKEQTDLVYLEMNSNVRSFSTKYGISEFEWSVFNTKSDQVTIMDWAPKGTRISNTDNFKVDVELVIPVKIGTVNVGTSFNLLNKNTTITGGVSSSSRYELSLTTDTPVQYPNYQDLCALVLYDTNLAGTTWYWNWHYART